MSGVQFCRFVHHRQIGTTVPTGRRRLLTNVLKLTRHDMPLQLFNSTFVRANAPSATPYKFLTLTLTFHFQAYSHVYFPVTERDLRVSFPYPRSGLTALVLEHIVGE